jgi:phospholipase C
MNGFDLTPSYRPDNLQLGSYAQSSLPVYWTYAQNFVVADHYFTTIAGPSTPNHLATIAAQSPIFDNPLCFSNCLSGSGCQAPPNSTFVPVWDQDTCVETGNAVPCFDIPSVVDSFPDSLSWRGYGDVESIGIDSAFFLIKSIGGNTATTSAHIRPTSQFLADLAVNDIPNFVHVDSVPVAAQEGPPGSTCPGQNYTIQFVNAVMQSSYWNETAVLITWDDWGGWYDHMAPAAEFCPNGAFFYPGFRVPLVIISPWAKHGYVLTTVTEHASIPRLVEELFGLPFMTARDPHARDAKVGSLMGAFDFTQTPQQPLILQPLTCP